MARKNHTTVSQIRRLNNLSNRTLLRVGMSLKVPDHGGAGVNNVTEEDAQTGTVSNGPAPASASAVPAVDTRSFDFHTVRRGDNISAIASKYRIPVDELLRHVLKTGALREAEEQRARLLGEGWETVTLVG